VSRRLGRGSELVVASHNPGKIREIADLLRPYAIGVLSAADLAIPEPDETETTFAGNARLKALHSARISGRSALADDSGLEVEALHGAPGIYSARWAGPEKDFAAAMARVERELAAKGTTRPANRRANFTAALCFATSDGATRVFEGKVFGSLVWPPRGEEGFGYDPMFLPDGETETFGQMQPDRKHAISHRARAFRLFVEACCHGDA
jgi:XTP/dITP diphosphohydrolase